MEQEILRSVYAILGWIYDIISATMDWLRLNMEWVKDLITALVSICAVIVAYKTYRSARKSVFAPLRTEVFKRQAEKLTDLLSLLEERSYSMESSLDYFTIVDINRGTVLRRFGLLQGFEKDRWEGETAMGWKAENTESNDERPVRRLGGDITEDPKEGVGIGIIWTTRRYLATIKVFRELSNDAFIPSSIQAILKKILADVDHNFFPVLQGLLQDHVKESAGIEEGPVLNGYASLYERFKSAKRDHSKDAASLKKEIIKYLRIDEKL